MNDELAILVDGDGSRVTITLNRPAVINSLDETMVAALHDALDMCADARVVVGSHFDRLVANETAPGD